MTAERARRAKVDKWPIVRVHRSQIDLAEYNPRTIDRAAAKNLQEGLKKHGLADKLTLNRRSEKKGFVEKYVTTPEGERLWVGMLVGGHQRLSQIDAMEKDQDYTLEVILVDVDLKQEREMNVALNNLSLQGQYDAEALKALVEMGSEQFDIGDAGFGPMELQAFFDMSGVDIVVPGLEQTLSVEHQTETAKEALAGAQELTKARVDERISKEEQIAKIKEKKKEARERAKKEDDAKFYLTVVFQDREQMELAQQALVTETKYVDGVRLLSMLGLPTSGRIGDESDPVVAGGENGADKGGSG